MIKKIIKEVFEKFGFEVRNKSYYEARNAFNTQRSVINLINPDDQINIFDVGAFDGRSSIQYNKLFPMARIFSFEPFNESYDLLLAGVKKFTNIKTFNLGLYEISGKLDLNCNNLPSTNSILVSNEMISEIDIATKTINKQTIEVTTLDQFTKLNEIDRIDILKLDVQGTELSVLKGSTELLTNQKIRVIYLETEFVEIYKNQPLFSDVFDFLSKYNYKFINFYNFHFDSNNKLLWSDAIFLSEEVEKQVSKTELFS